MDSKYYRKQSQKQEKSLAKKLNGKVTVASGAKWFQKADVRTDVFLGECKTTEKEAYRLNFKIWEKVKKEALRDGLRIPILEIEIKKQRYIIYNIREGRLRPDNKNFSYKLLSVYLEDKASWNMKQNEIEGLMKIADNAGKVPVIRLVRNNERLALMRTGDFEVCIEY